MKELLFSVTASDCKWEYLRGTGPGGQKRNKTESAVRCTHEPSGAIGFSDITRSQHQNKRDAFLKMSKTKEFQSWHRIETAKRMGKYVDINKTIDEAMEDKNLRIEVYNCKQKKWEEINK